MKRQIAYLSNQAYDYTDTKHTSINRHRNISYKYD